MGKRRVWREDSGGGGRGRPQPPSAGMADQAGEAPFRWDYRWKTWRATADFEYGGKRYRKGSLVSEDAVNARARDAARRLGFSDALIHAIEENLKLGQGRHLIIELSDLAGLGLGEPGEAGLKPATREYEGRLPFKGSDQIELESDAYGFVRNPRTGEPIALSDPDIMAFIEEGQIMPDAATLEWIEYLNQSWVNQMKMRGVDVSGDKTYYPFRHSARTTYYQVPDARLDIALKLPKHSVDFYLDAD